MAAENGAAVVALEALDEQLLRSRLVLAVADKTNLTTEQLVDLLCFTFPKEYSHGSRELLTEIVAKITPLPCGSGDATEVPSPVTNKRRKTGELGNGEGGLGDVSGNNRPMFRDLLGMVSVIDKLKSDVIVPLHQLKLLRHLGVKSIPRILLHGPPRCGKTTLARALANEAGLPLYEITAADLVSGASGAPEENIREVFSTAYMRAPSVVFIDEIDAITSSLQKDIVKQLMACMDEPYRLVKPVDHDTDSKSSNSLPGYVLVIGATNRPDALDPVLRRRFDREIVIDLPGLYDRSIILSVLRHDAHFEYENIGNLAKCTLGFVVEDLAALVKMAGTCAANRIMKTRRYEIYKKRHGVQIEDWYRQQFSDEEMKNLIITKKDFMEAVKSFRPPSSLECFSTTPNAKWDDVGGLQLLKLKFERHIVKHIKFPELYKDLGVALKTTFFLFGPSGCGKTLIVEALANEAGANFLHIKFPELLIYGNWAELVVHVIFNYARAHPPCIVFFDQFEAINRGGGEWRLADFEQLLREFLCAKQRSGVYLICATNRPNVPSRLVSLSGYFDNDLYVPLPTPEERGAILKALARNKPIDADVDLMALGKDIACENFSGADLSRLMKEAIKAAIDRPTLSGGDHNIPWTIKDVDFKKALPKISPSVSAKEMKNWEPLANIFQEAHVMEW